MRRPGLRYFELPLVPAPGRSLDWILRFLLFQVGVLPFCVILAMVDEWVVLSAAPYRRFPNFHPPCSGIQKT